MAGFIKRNIERVETQPLNTRIHRKAFNDFKDCCKHLGYPMNMVLETFMAQYANGRFVIAHDEIMKWKPEEYDTDVLNTTFCKEIHNAFKSRCRAQGYFLKYVLTAFMEIYAQQHIQLEYVDIEGTFLQQNSTGINVCAPRLELQQKVTNPPRGFMQCPFCGRLAEASSDNWCLVQRIGDEKKYLACKECEGFDGEINY